VMTAATTMSFDSSAQMPATINGKFRHMFSQILHRWSQDELTMKDVEFLESTPITENEYLVLTEDFNLRHGVELMNYRICLIEYPTALHEYMNRKMDKWMDRSFGDDIEMLGSTSDKRFLIPTNVQPSYMIMAAEDKQTPPISLEVFLFLPVTISSSSARTASLHILPLSLNVQSQTKLAIDFWRMLRQNIFMSTHRLEFGLD
jgi:hypothetical protein